MNASPDNRSNARLPELDGVRGLAISLVLFQHFVRNMIIPGRSSLGDFIKTELNMGWSGVDLFFVLSGFLIGGILMDNRSSENYFKVFYIRRFCRILPPYLLTVISFYAAFRYFPAAYTSQEWFTGLFARGGTPLWVNATFLQNAFHAITGRANGEWLIATWTLAVEEHFYLMLPLAIWLIRPSRLMPVLLSVIVLYPLLLLYFLIFTPHLHDFFITMIPVRGNALLIGVLCAFVYRQASWWAWLKQNHKHLYVIFFSLLIGMIYMFPRYDTGAHMYDQLLFYNHMMDLFYACLLLLVLAHGKGFIAAAMRFAPLRKLGIISYSLYLYHMAVIFLFYGLIDNRLPRYLDQPSDTLISIAALVVSLLLASLSWYFLEKPIIAWGHSFNYVKGQKEPVVAEPKILAQP